MPRPSSNSCYKNISLGMWNIQGLKLDKIQDPHFVNFLSKMHVVSLVETWSDSGNCINIPGYKYQKKNIKRPGDVLVVLLYM